MAVRTNKTWNVAVDFFNGETKVISVFAWSDRAAFNIARSSFPAGAVRMVSLTKDN